MLKPICILLLLGTVSSESSLYSAISRMLSEARSSRDQVPVIVLVSNKALQSSALGLTSSSEERQDSAARSSEMDSLWKIFAKQSDRKPSRLNHHSHPPSNAVYIQRPRADIDRPRNLYKSSKPLRSRVYNSLMYLRNRYNCDQQDDCKDECAEIPTPKKEKKCEKKCEIEYDCDKSMEDDNPSTRAPHHSEEKIRDCKRC